MGKVAGNYEARATENMFFPTDGVTDMIENQQRDSQFFNSIVERPSVGPRISHLPGLMPVTQKINNFLRATKLDAIHEDSARFTEVSLEES